MQENEQDKTSCDNKSQSGSFAPVRVPSDSEAFRLLSPGMQKWVSKQGWKGFRPIQRASIGTLLSPSVSTVSPSSSSTPPSLVISANVAGGKALTDSTPVLTTRGWMPIRWIKEGDLVYARDGRSYPVTGVFHQGKLNAYRLTLDDGRHVDCNGDHLWLACDYEDMSPHEIVLSTREMMESGLFANKRGKRFLRFGIPQCEPMAKIPPSERGWRQAREYRDAAGNQACDSMFEIGSSSYDALLGSNGGIIESYVMSLDPAQRLNLLSFLLKPHMDHVSQSSTIIKLSDTSSSLSQLITCLCRSLGIIVKIRSIAILFPIVPSEAESYWLEVMIPPALFSHIKSHTERCLYTFPWSEHDLASILEANGNKQSRVKSIESLDKKESMTCISVASPDHTYITRDYIVTHNTEAAFLPMLSIIESSRIDCNGFHSKGGIVHQTDSPKVEALYIAPLKALINDQYRRLSMMARDCGTSVYTWHSDASQGQKNALLKQHDGVLMTTPESLESFLMNRGEWCSKYLCPKAIVIDELHTFLDGSRGKQVFSLLDRIDFIRMLNGLDSSIRIGLSATLSRLDIVASMLSPRMSVAIISQDSIPRDESSKSQPQDSIDIEVKCFDPPTRKEGQLKTSREDDIAIGKEIIKESSSQKTLTFAQSRMQVETIASTINDICKHDSIKQEAFPHHGNLSKEAREALENRLVSTDKPTIAVATVTLELGIDIGDIYKVFQVGPTSTVSSLRQRAGRSGRRDAHKRLECLITASRNDEDMEKDLLTMISEIELMNAGWFEPPNNNKHYVSVLVSEILSILKQYGSAYDDEIISMVSDYGAFSDMPKDMIMMVISDMEKAGFIEKMNDGTLLIGQSGEAEINDYRFYATFMSENSYTIRSSGKSIGEITPPDSSLQQLASGGTFMLGGRHWQVIPPIDAKSKVINVTPSSIKSQFLVPISRGSFKTSGMIKRGVISLLNGKASSLIPPYLDKHGVEMLCKAREYASKHRLNGLGLTIHDDNENALESITMASKGVSRNYSDEDSIVRVSPPLDDASLNAIIKVFAMNGIQPGWMNGIPLWRLSDAVEASIAQWDEITRSKEKLIDDAMLNDIRNAEKYNRILSDETLRYAYVDEKINLVESKRWLDAFSRFHRGL